MTKENLKLMGRIVGGNPGVMQDVVDYHTKQKVLNDDGTPKKECRCEIAIPKQDFLRDIWPALNEEVSKLYPQYNGMNPDTYEQSRFAFKVINGDSPACPQGSKVPYNTRDGYAGCYVVKVRTSAFQPGIYKFENGAYRHIDSSEIKCGDYVVASINLTAHNEKDGGLYWNPNAFELVGYGKEIKGSGAADPMALFGGQTYQLPAGASAVPTSSAPATAQMPGTQPMAQPAPMTQPAPAPMAMPQAQPMAQPAPAYDFVQNAGVNCATSFTQPVASAVAQPQSMPQMGNGTAPFATTFPTR